MTTTDHRIDPGTLAQLRPGDRVYARRSTLIYQLTERTDLMDGAWRAELIHGAHTGTKLITDRELLQEWCLVPSEDHVALPDALRAKAPDQPTPAWGYGDTDLLTAAADEIDRGLAVEAAARELSEALDAKAQADTRGRQERAADAALGAWATLRAALAASGDEPRARPGVSDDEGDLRWLVGHLAAHAVEGVGLPARLGPLVAACRAGYDPARFTLVYVAGATGPPPPPDRPGLIGRDDTLTQTLARQLHNAVAGLYDHTPVSEIHRGREFELRGDDGHVWHVEVTLDRVEASDAG